MSNEDKLDACIENLGGFGRFQKFAYFITSFSITGPGFWIYQMGYLMQEPRYLCQLAGSVSGSEADTICTSENICSGDSRILAWKIDESHESALQNWHKEFDLMCWPNRDISLIMSLYFLGWASTLLWMPRLGDVYGRKIMVAGSNAVSLVLFLGVLFAPNISFLCCMLFLWGCFDSCRSGIGYPYMIELMPKKHQHTVGTFWSM